MSEAPTQLHTPGPWRVEQGTTLIWGTCNPDDATTYGMGFPVAEARTIRTHGGVSTIEEAEANARLIAMAPDLLAERDTLRAELAEARARIERTVAALSWAMDEIDALSNLHSEFAYPQGMAMIGREVQADNYFEACAARKSAVAKEQG